MQAPDGGRILEFDEQYMSPYREMNGYTGVLPQNESLMERAERAARR
jgi:hypothetical protein